MRPEDGEAVGPGAVEIGAWREAVVDFENAHTVQEGPEGASRFSIGKELTDRRAGPFLETGRDAGSSSSPMVIIR